MTLARKGTRSIVVDATSYRWTVAPNDEPGVAIVVEHADAPGQRLVSWVRHGTIIRPRLVREAILDGLRAGWVPTATGRDVVRRGTLPEEPSGALKQCPCCDYFTLGARGEYEICPVCFWEDDGLDVDALDVHSGPNHLTLEEARENFARFGACDEAGRAHALPEERRGMFAKERMDLLDLAKRAGASVTEISGVEADRIRHAWDDTFGRSVLECTGKPIYGYYRWHAFSWGFTRAESGKRATELYLAEPSAEWLLLPEDEDRPAFRLGGCGLIDLGRGGEDLYVMPASLDWTMVFTHEQPEFGPFFCRRDWVGERAVPIESRYIACVDHRRYVDAGCRWAFRTLEEPGIVQPGHEIDPARLLATEDYWNPPVEERNAWLREDILPTARSFLRRHAGHRLLYMVGEPDPAFQLIGRYDDEP